MLRLELLHVAPLVLASLFLNGCDGVEWEQANYVRSLRVLGVRAEPASLSPGQFTRLALLCANGQQQMQGESSCKDVEVAWFASCNNPKDDDPSNCFDQYSSWFGRGSRPVSSLDMERYKGRFVLSSEFEFVAPKDILAETLKAAGHSVRFGTSYIYYAVCDGKLFSTQGGSDRLPVECRDRKTGARLDQRRFAVGRTTIYSYDIIHNDNPVLTWLGFDETLIPLKPCSISADCKDGLECHEDGVCAPVVAPCLNRAELSCRPHEVRVGLTDESFFLSGPDGAPIDSARKSVWLSYYTNEGGTPDDFTFALKQGADAQLSSAGAWWRAPSFPSRQSRIWIIVRDDRGGQAWRVQPVIVR